MENQDETKNDNIKSRRGEKGIENLKKARLARIEALQRKKELKEKFFNIDDSDGSSSDSSSDDDEPVLKIKNKKKKDKEDDKEVKYPFHKQKHDKLKNEVEMLKNMMLQMASGGKIKKPRPKKEASQRVIQIIPPTQPIREEVKKIDDNLEQHLKRKILNF